MGEMGCWGGMAFASRVSGLGLGFQVATSTLSPKPCEGFGFGLGVSVSSCASWQGRRRGV